MRYDATQQKLSWFRDQQIAGRLRLQPPYQRKPVWQSRQKCFLVESVLKEFPIPEVFIQIVTDPHGDTVYTVVDGQQRIRTLLQFMGLPDGEQSEFAGFSLDSLSPGSEWFAKKFVDLDDDEKRTFYGTKLAVRELVTDNEDDVKEVFRRLNKYTEQLKAQELRNATFAGPFAEAVTKLADEFADFLSENRIVTVASIRRMGDIEFIAELLIGTLHGPQSGRGADIDAYYEQYEDYETEFPGQSAARKAMRATFSLFESHIEDLSARWRNKTDFYTLFVLLARHQDLRKDFGSRLEALNNFASEVDAFVADDTAKVSRQAADYARALLRGATDKSRRASRNRALAAHVGVAAVP